MKDEVEIPDFKIALHATHPELNLSDFCNRIGIPPKRIWTVGEQRTTPNGEILQGTNSDSYCSIPIVSEGRGPLSTGIETCVSLCRAHEAALNEIQMSGGSLSLFIGWFLSRNGGDVFEWNLLKKLGDLKITIDLHIYPESPADTPRGRATRTHLGKM